MEEVKTGFSNYIRPQVNLTDADGNSFNIMGICQSAARRRGVPKKEIDLFLKECMSQDYDHLLRTVMRYFDVS